MGRHPHIVVGTPGRILDLIERRVLPLDHMRFVVCDEVDRMFDIGFRDDIRRILGGLHRGRTRRFSSRPPSTRTSSAWCGSTCTTRSGFSRPRPQEQLTNPEAAQFYVGRAAVGQAAGAQDADARGEARAGAGVLPHQAVGGQGGGGTGARRRERRRRSTAT